MSKGMIECAVCHREFALIAEDHYVAKDPVATGISAVVSNTIYPYDAIDCPHCGCQNILQKRKPFACPCDFGICDECDCECTEEDEEVSIDEMRKFLMDFCNEDQKTCEDCPLHTPKFRCGRGIWFDTGMSDEDIKDAYHVAKESCKCTPED